MNKKNKVQTKTFILHYCLLNQKSCEMSGDTNPTNDGGSVEQQENMPRLIDISREYVRTYMKQYDSSHDYSHIERVLSLAKHIEASETRRANGSRLYDSDIVILASLLHDVGDRKYLKPGQDGTRAVFDFLSDNGADDQTAAKVQEIINHVSYSSEIKNPSAVTRAITRHAELAVVQDADRLDALGAVGIGRCFAFSASRINHGALENAIDHFADKLVHLKDMMKTDTGREMAVERTRRIQIFREWWVEESTAKEDE